MSMFRDFWAAQDEEAASYGPRAEIFSGAASEGPGKGPAEDSSAADEQLTEAAVNGTVSGEYHGPATARLMSWRGTEENFLMSLLMWQQQGAF